MNSHFIIKITGIFLCCSIIYSCVSNENLSGMYDGNGYMLELNRDSTYVFSQRLGGWSAGYSDGTWGKINLNQIVLNSSVQNIFEIPIVVEEEKNDSLSKVLFDFSKEQYMLKSDLFEWAIFINGQKYLIKSDTILYGKNNKPINDFFVQGVLLHPDSITAITKYTLFRTESYKPVNLKSNVFKISNIRYRRLGRPNY